MPPLVLNSLQQLRFQRGIEHLYRLGPRATGELLVEVAGKIGGWPVILGCLAEYERRLTPQMLRLTGGDRFPRRPLRLVPPSEGARS
jgi:hypothetical protein